MGWFPAPLKVGQGLLQLLTFYFPLVVRIPDGRPGPRGPVSTVLRPSLCLPGSRPALLVRRSVPPVGVTNRCFSGQTGSWPNPVNSRLTRTGMAMPRKSSISEWFTRSDKRIFLKEEVGQNRGARLGAAWEDLRVAYQQAAMPVSLTNKLSSQEEPRNR